MIRRRSPDPESRPPLPHEPLLFAPPLSLPGPEPETAAVLRELPPEQGWMVAKALRAVYAWVRAAGTGDDSFDPAPLLPLAGEATGATFRWKEGGGDREGAEMPLSAPVSCILSFLLHEPEGSPADVARACFLGMGWAAQHGYYATATAFVEAAWVVDPTHAGWAWLAGRSHRLYGQVRDAEAWYRRAARVARWNQDWEMFALSLNSLGTLAYDQGRYATARARLAKALRLARRYSLHSLQGAILHDLFALALMQGESDAAFGYARGAFEKYQPSHERLPALAYDIAYWWVMQGYFARALPILRLLCETFEDEIPRFQVLAATARAAGACNEESVFLAARQRISECSAEALNSYKAAAAFLDIGLGAASLERWTEAAEALDGAATAAARHGIPDVKLRVEVAQEAVRSRTPADLAPRPIVRAHLRHPADQFALELAEVIEHGVTR